MDQKCWTEKVGRMLYKIQRDLSNKEKLSNPESVKKLKGAMSELSRFVYLWGDRDIDSCGRMSLTEIMAYLESDNEELMGEIS